MCLFQTDRITALQVRIEEIQRLLEDSCCIPEVYSPIKQPEVVHLVLQGAGGEGAGGEGAGGEGAGGEGAGQEEVKKTFLLDCGRLQLEQVKLAFQLATVELIVGKQQLRLCCFIEFKVFLTVLL